jgi:enterochelin esterase family protein
MNLSLNCRKVFVWDSPQGIGLFKNFLLPALLCLLFLSQIACAQNSSKQTSEQVKTAIDWTIEKGGTPKGKVEAFTVQDKQYNRQRKIWVYTPPNYDPKAADGYRLLISFDGEDYIKGIPSPIILDNLLAAGKIYPVVQVMVDNSDDRLGDLANHQKFADFVAKDLLPWTQKKYRVTTEAGKTALCGYSAGGLGAAYVAFRYPKLFGNVLSQSGAFWRGDEGASQPSQWLTAQFQNSPKLNVRFYLVVGGEENIRNAVGLTMLETSRHLRDVLKAKGYDIGYLEAPGAGHMAESWRMELGDGLIYLIGK